MITLRDPRLPKRFWDKVEIGPGGCWLWTAYCTPKGYAKIRWQGACSAGHRIAYIYLMGEIPEGLHLDHLCRVRHCVNPAHLEPVTNAENQRRGLVNQMLHATHCKRGHLFDEENTRMVPRKDKPPYRLCRICSRMRKKDFLMKQKRATPSERRAWVRKHGKAPSYYTERKAA